MLSMFCVIECAFFQTYRARGKAEAKQQAACMSVRYQLGVM